MDHNKPYRYIREIAGCQSMSIAAENLGIGQPALSQFVKRIEKELGIELFDRSTIPLSLTEAGKSYLETAIKIEDAENQLRKKIENLKTTSNIDIKVGISTTRAPYMLPGILEMYLSLYPGRHVTVVEGTTNELNEKLITGDLDLIISLLNEDTERFEREILFEEKILLAAHKKYSDLTSIELIRTLPIISAGKGQILWEQLNEIRQSVNEVNNQIECNNMITAISLARKGLGTVLVPSYVNDHSAGNELVFSELPPEAGGSNSRTVCVFFRHEQFLGDAEHQFIECARKCCNN